MRRRRSSIEAAIDAALVDISCYGLSHVNIRHEDLTTGNAESDALIGAIGVKKLVIEVVYDTRMDDGRIFFHSGALVWNNNGLWARIKRMFR